MWNNPLSLLTCKWKLRSLDFLGSVNISLALQSCGNLPAKEQLARRRQNNSVQIKSQTFCRLVVLLLWLLKYTIKIYNSNYNCFIYKSFIQMWTSGSSSVPSMASVAAPLQSACKENHPEINSHGK